MYATRPLPTHSVRKIFNYIKILIKRLSDTKFNRCMQRVHKSATLLAKFLQIISTGAHNASISQPPSSQNFPNYTPKAVKLPKSCKLTKSKIQQSTRTIALFAEIPNLNKIATNLTPSKILIKSAFQT